MINFREARKRIDLVSVVRLYTTLDSQLRGPCPFCGGRDRFFVLANRELCGCRKCDSAGLKIWDVFSFFAEANKDRDLTQVAAARELLGLPEHQAGFSLQTPKPEPWKDVEWQTRVSRAVRRAYLELTGSDPRGMDYLASRGINPETCRAFRLGFDPELFDPQTSRCRPAILLPWLDGDRVYFALKHRFIEKGVQTGSDVRFGQRKLSRPILFGLHKLVGRTSLTVCEGEMNALSVWQCASEQTDVVSIGAEYNGESRDALRSLIFRNKYQAVTLWVDREKIAGELAAVVVRAGARAAFAKKINGWDANEVLCRANAERVAIAVTSGS